MDGASVDYVLEAYRKSFAHGKQQQTVNIVKLK
jgi:hypothetical protein